MKLDIFYCLHQFFFLIDAVPIKKPFAPIYRLCFSCVGRQTTHIALQNRVVSKAKYLINSPVTVLISLITCRIVTSFDIFCYIHGYCMELSTGIYLFSVHLTNVKANQYVYSFSFFTGTIWNTPLRKESHDTLGTELNLLIWNSSIGRKWYSVGLLSYFLFFTFFVALFMLK